MFRVGEGTSNGYWVHLLYALALKVKQIVRSRANSFREGSSTFAISSIAEQIPDEIEQASRPGGP
jgi:hypothetical protein